MDGIKRFVSDNKTSLLSAIYTGKEFLFFFIGVFTLTIIPYLGADRAGTIQLLVLGSALTLEGFSSVADMGLTFIVDKAIPWMEEQRKKRQAKKVKR